MLIPSLCEYGCALFSSLSRRVNANSQHVSMDDLSNAKLIKKGEC